LRASVAVEGRSVTLFEEIHPQQKYGDRNVHRRFLSRLAKLLPAGSAPIIMTDAGFRSTWFDLVNRRHWQWIGRIRGKDMIRVADGPWRRCTDFYREATRMPQTYPDAHYVRANPTPCRLVLAQRAAKGRTRRTRLGQRARSRTSLKASRNAREPWLLATSHGLDHLSADAIIALYSGVRQFRPKIAVFENPTPAFMRVSGRFSESRCGGTFVRYVAMVDTVCGAVRVAACLSRSLPRVAAATSNSSSPTAMTPAR
jgi:hypothetical protein